MTELTKSLVEAIVRADHGDPFSVLGMHTTPKGEIVVRTFQPRTLGVQVIDAATGKPVADLTLIHPEGLYEGIVPQRANRFVYRLRLRRWEGDQDIEDPYRFPPVLGEMDVYLLAEGTHLRTYERMGAHVRKLEGIEGTAFTVWAISTTGTAGSIRCGCRWAAASGSSSCRASAKAPATSTRYAASTASCCR